MLRAFALVIACLVVGSKANLLSAFCDPPAEPENGYYHRDPNFIDYIEGDSIEFECKPGFELSNPGPSVCTFSDGNGVWDPPPPTCDDIQCPTASHKDEFYYITNGKPYTWITLGEWELSSDPSGPVELRDCTYPVGNTLRVSPGECDIVCQACDSRDNCCEYRYTIIVYEKSCSLVRIEFGTMTIDNPLPSGNALISGTASFSCDSGYELVGESFATCISDTDFAAADGEEHEIGKNDPYFDNIPTCRPRSCGEPTQIDNGVVDYDPSNTNVGDTASYTCNEGYGIEGQDTINCVFPDGANAPYWESEPSCQDKECPTFAEKEDEFYALVGSARGVDVRITAMQASDISEPVTVTCDPAPGTYPVAVGDCVIKCTARDGVGNECEGSYTITVFKKSCGNPDNLEFGNVEFTSTEIGDNARYSCEGPKYFLDGDEIATCALPDESEETLNDPNILPSWSGSRRCLPRSCGPPESITNGDFTLETPNTNLGAIVSYRCNAGFELRGNPTIECVYSEDAGDATWQQAPRCQAKCSEPEKPNDGGVTVNGLNVGDTATYSCNEGFTPDRDDLNIECQESPSGDSASWSAGPPACNPVKAAAPPELPRVRCPAGFRAPGNSNRCFLYLSEPDTWEEQAKKCKDRNAQLALPDSDVEARYLEEVVSNLPSRFWLGAHDLVQCNQWMDMESFSLVYTNWGSKQPSYRDPSDRFGNDCVSSDASGKWANRCCYNSLPAFCEADPLGSEECAGEGFVFYQGRCLRFFNEHRFFESHCKKCQELGGVLATASNENEAKSLYDFYLNYESGPAWFNLHDQVEEGSFQTTSLASANYFEWASGEEPKGRGDCVELTADGWRDQCCYVRQPAICELKECPEGYTRKGKRCYRLLNHRDMWEFQEKECRKDGANLAVIFSDAELKRVRSLTDKTIWFGCHDQINEGTYQSPTKKELSYFNWAGGNAPAPSTKQDCCSLHGNNMQVECCYTNRPAVCSRRVRVNP